MKQICIVGLGNPGSKYQGTRHNIGFDWVDAVMSSSLFASQKPKFQSRYQAFWWHGTFNGLPVHFLKPTTYMNESGRALKAWQEAFPGETNYFIVLDDIDLPLGTIRFRDQGSDGGHRGLRSILLTLGMEEVSRLRLGVGRPPEGVSSEEYVLRLFEVDEQKIVEVLLADAASIFEIFVTHKSQGQKDEIFQKINGRKYGS